MLVPRAKVCWLLSVPSGTARPTGAASAVGYSSRAGRARKGVMRAWGRSTQPSPVPGWGLRDGWGARASRRRGHLS